MAEPTAAATTPATPAEPDTKTVNITLPTSVHQHFLDAATEDSRSLKNYLELEIKKLFKYRTSKPASGLTVDQ